MKVENRGIWRALQDIILLKWSYKGVTFFYIYSLLLLIFLILVIVGIWYTPYDPLKTNLANSLQAPSEVHWLGTDVLGRDVLSRIWYGAHLSLLSAISIVLSILVIGTFLGGIAALYGGWVEKCIMTLVDVVLSFPSIIIAIVIAGILGGSMVNAIIALSVVCWARYARIVRSLILKLLNEDYVVAARLLGGSRWVILRRHMLPQIIPFLCVSGAMDIGSFMLEVAGLSFLGLGIQAPLPDWGNMLSEGRQYFFLAPWIMVAPGCAIFATVSLLNLWGNALRDKLDVIVR